AGDGLVGLVEHAARDETHPRQREVHVVGALSVGEVERPALLERAALAVTETEVTAARDVDVVAPSRQVLDLVGAFGIRARRLAVVRKPGAVDLNACAAKRPPAVGGKHASANDGGAC